WRCGMDVKRSAMPSIACVIDAARVILIFCHGSAQPHPSCDDATPNSVSMEPAAGQVDPTQP
ncbi:hypothetical protein, partial [Mesorhizobium sp. M1403]|uniref:hypothetical protein n=1 Tax=Mesorhizobium sp. M1403 TaxID=2957097 RepID=UPI0033352C1C